MYAIVGSLFISRSPMVTFNWPFSHLENKSFHLEKKTKLQSVQLIQEVNEQENCRWML